MVRYSSKVIMVTRITYLCGNSHYRILTSLKVETMWSFLTLSGIMTYFSDYSIIAVQEVRHVLPL